MGVEPTPSAWEADVLPIYYICLSMTLRCYCNSTAEQYVLYYNLIYLSIAFFKKFNHNLYFFSYS